MLVRAARADVVTDVRGGLGEAFECHETLSVSRGGYGRLNSCAEMAS
jgi:hypothetical protein